MKYANVTSINYQYPDTITTQGSYSSIKKFLKKGYFAKESRNGYWVLVKPAKVIVTLKNAFGEFTYDMKSDILMHYNKERISETLVTTFTMDIQNKSLEIHVNQNGNYKFV